MIPFPPVSRKKNYPSYQPARERKEKVYDFETLFYRGLFFVNCVNVKPYENKAQTILSQNAT